LIEVLVYQVDHDYPIPAAHITEYPLAMHGELSSDDYTGQRCPEPPLKSSRFPNVRDYFPIGTGYENMRERNGELTADRQYGIPSTQLNPQHSSGNFSLQHGRMPPLAYFL
jgi:hypothetical protein